MGILNAIGRAGKAMYKSGALPEMLRAGIVAAANPTRGAVGTAGDIFGALGAVEDDRLRRQEMARQRELQQLAIQRQAEEDARDAALNDARIAEYRTRAEFNTRRGTQQIAKGVPPTKLQLYKEAFDHYKGRGFSDEDAHIEARSIALGTPSPELFNKRTATTDAAQRNRELEKWRSDPNLQQQFPKFEDYYKSTGIGASMADTAGQVVTAKKEAEAPFTIRTLRGPDKYFQSLFEKGPDGKPKWKWVEATTSDGKPVETPKPAPRQPTASDAKLDREKTISSIVNRVLKEDSSGRPENALRNVQQFYQNDPEVQQYKAEVMWRLQKLVQGKASTGKAETFIEVNDTAKEKRAKKAQQQGKAAVEVWTRDANGNLVRAK